MNLWNETPGLCKELPTITPYLPERKTSRAAIVIFPGGGYGMRAQHEGKGYAEFFAANGITSFVVDYRVSPHRFPLPLLDARRAVRTVRAFAEEYGIDKDKIAVMGSSAGGHLAALTSTYRGVLESEDIDAIDLEDSIPNAQILCYPVICPPEPDGVAHIGSYRNLLGDDRLESDKHAVAPSLIADESAPPAFIWHTANDGTVNVINSYRYATVLREKNVSVEMHIFPDGRHGLGLAPASPHVAQWAGLMLNWIGDLGWR